MDIHRQRYSQLNSRLRQQHQQRSGVSSFQPAQSSIAYPVVLPTAASRPQHRQQARTKPTQAPMSSHGKQQQQHHHASPSAPDQKYITLANLTKILQVLQTQVKITDNETSTVMSSSTSNSAKQRVQQHLQETAMRWWKPTRTSESLPAPSSIARHSHSHVSTKVAARAEQNPDNLPVLTIVSNSTRHLNPASSNDTNSSINDGSDSPMVRPPKVSHIKLLRQEPIIMATPGRRLHAYDHYQYPNHVSFAQPRLIRQT